MIAALVGSMGWYFLRNMFEAMPIINEIEPMLVGLVFSVGIHTSGLLKKK
jgi:hypothetical protein